MKQIFRLASFVFILSVFLTQHAFAQHPVIFETFQEDYNQCPDPTQFQSDMTKVVNAEGAKNYTKMIHLNYHVGDGGFDPMAQFCPYSGNVGDRLNGVTSSMSNYLFFGSVDRITIYNGSKAEPDIGTNGINSSWVSDMENAIETESQNTPPDQIQLDSATLDKSAQYYTFKAYLTVTATSTLSDSMIMRYAILEDGVSDPVCSTKTIHNDVVRYITIGDSVVFLPGTSSGTTKNITFTQKDLIGADSGQPGALNAANLRFVAFLEQDGGGDFSVVDAKQLLSNFDTVHSPPPTLAITNNFVDSKTYSPGSIATIYYSSTNLVGGAIAYYSLDNGTTWRYISNSSSSPVNWTVPDSATTHGKFKLVGANYPSLVSIQDSNFTIANAASVTILKPQPAQVIKGGSSDTIVWTKNAVDSVTLQYYIADANGDFTTAVVLGKNLTDTSFVWTVPDTGRLGAVEIQLVPVNNGVAAYSVVDTINGTIILNSVASLSQPVGLSITNIFPNPASNGQEIVVQYSEAVAKPITVQLLDLLGRVMPESYTTDNQAIHLNTNALTAGAYVVRLSDGSNTVSKRVEIIR